MDLKLAIDDTLALNSQAMGYQSRNGSFSDVSSVYNPFTPTSECSTPLRRSSSAFDTSFSSYADSATFDMTPPSSALSAHFPFDFRTGMQPQDMICQGFPATPTKYNVMMDAGLDSHSLNGQLTPPGGVDFLPFSNFHTAGPFASPCNGLNGEDPESMDRLWSQISGDTPVNFGDHQRMNSVFEPNHMLRPTPNMSSPSCRTHIASSRRHVHMAEAQQKAAALQSVQKSPSLKNRTRPRRLKHAPSRPIPMCGPVKNIPLRQYYCDQGCTGKAYSRQEHLKRHFLTAHNPQKPVIPCKFCPNDKMKIFDRADNYRQHLELHAKPGRKGRVEYHPAAAKELAHLKAQIKRRAPPKGRLRESAEDEDDE